jgi:PilZ domain-containing protein
MPADVSIVVADASRLLAIRESGSLPGRLMPFSSGSLGPAMESIRAYRPAIVAVDAIFAQSPTGAAFIDRVEAQGILGITIVLVAEHDGRWMTVSRTGARTLGQSAPAAAIASSAANFVAAKWAAGNTRRVPRFLVRGPLDVIVESGRADLVDMSVLGAQVVSLPVLRPRQKIKVALTDANETIDVNAHVAWSMFERPRLQVEPYYRIGLEFTGAAQQALEAYRLRHCGDQPIPYRGR